MLYLAARQEWQPIAREHVDLKSTVKQHICKTTHRESRKLV